MNRTLFVVTYIPLALLFSSPVTPWNPAFLALRFAVNGIAALANPTTWLAIAGSIALVTVAILRGIRIGRRQLHWLPIAALLIALAPFLIGLINGWNTSHAGAFGLLEYLLIAFAIASSLAPVILHVLCATFGGQRDPEVDNQSASPIVPRQR